MNVVGRLGTLTMGCPGGGDSFHSSTAHPYTDAALETRAAARGSSAWCTIDKQLVRAQRRRVRRKWRGKCDERRRPTRHADDGVSW
jgi:hypothetical protein